MYPNPRMQNWNAQPVPRLAQKEPEEEDFLRFEEDEDQEPEDHVTKQLKKAKESDEISYEKEYRMAPWMSKQTSLIRNPNVRLHNEIIELTNYLEPKEDEYKRREIAIQELIRIVKVEMPNVEIKPFGSFSTKLYLPNADIDLVLVDTQVNKSILMKNLAKILKQQPEKYTNLNIIASAKVPIIKFVDTEHNFNIDISFNKMDGLFQTREVLKSFKIYPEIKPLVFVIKIYLRQRNMNETYTGGVGSFLLFCLILSFLREFKRNMLERRGIEELKSILLSEYLIKFLEFYGLNFDTLRKKIIMKDSGKIVEKNTKDSGFSLMSPQCDTHDIGSAAFRIKEIFNTFKNRYYFCTNYNFKPGESILKYLINPSKYDF